MDDKLTDPNAVRDLVKDIHTDIARISVAVEEIRRYQDWLMQRQDALMARLVPPPRGRDTGTVPAQFRSGRWTMRDGTFPPGAGGISPSPQPGQRHANTAPGNLRSSD